MRSSQCGSQPQPLSRKIDAQAGMALEHAAHHEPGARDLLLVRVRADVAQRVVLEAVAARLRQVLRRALVHRERHAELLEQRPERLPVRIVERARRARDSGRIITPRKPSSRTQRRASASASPRSPCGTQRDAEQAPAVGAAELVQPVVVGAAQRDLHVGALEPREEQAERREQERRSTPWRSMSASRCFGRARRSGSPSRRRPARGCTA